jgi:beta-lactam-binding protein with PASTA domain
VNLLMTFVVDWIVSMLQPTVVRVPDLSEVGPVTASRQLRRLGLRPRTVRPESPGRYLRVRAQEPAPGTDAKRGTVVTLYLASGEGVQHAY